MKRITVINDELQKIVDEQANDEGLWSVPEFGTQSISEAQLQKELRRLHKAIENRRISPRS